MFKLSLSGSLDAQTMSLPDPSRTDENHLAAAARRDPAAFAELYRRYTTPVYRYLYSHVGDRAEAEELTAQVFTAAWEGIGSFRQEGAFAAWLFGIAHNKIRQHFRGQRKWLPWATVEPLLLFDWDPLAEAERREELERLSRLVTRLPADQQEMLRLRFAAGLSHAQIASLLGRTEAAIKMAFHRLLRQLQMDLEKT